MVVHGVPTVGGLLAILAQPTPEMRALRARLTGPGRFPSRGCAVVYEEHCEVL
jgi:hypothetical protein